MKCSALTALLLLAIGAFSTFPLAAQTPPAPKRPASALQLVITTDAMMTMDGGRLLAKTDKQGLTIYSYIKDRLTRGIL